MTNEEKNFWLGREDRKVVFGSVLVKLQSDVRLIFAAGDRDAAGKYVYTRFGFEADWLSVGSTAVSLDYCSGSDAVSDGDSSGSFGIAVVQDFDQQNIEAYIGYREYSYDDDTAVTFQDASSFIIGARWQF